MYLCKKLKLKPMKKFLLTKILLLATICLQAQTLYVQPIDGEQIGFSIVENPKITFGNGTMTINETLFQLTHVQNLSFVESVTTSIVGANNYLPLLQAFPNPVINDLRITIDELQIGEIIELFDMNGRRVYSRRHSALDAESRSKGIAGQARNDELVINMTPFPNGTYILRIGNQSLQIIKTQ